MLASMLLLPRPSAGADYTVSYNPYANVDWATTLRCQSQHHDHVDSAAKVAAMDAAGYCAIMFMSYSGYYRPSTSAEWNAAGRPLPDPGVCVGWCGQRRWPPTSFGAPALPLANLRFYLPGAEEVALLANGLPSAHLTSPFLTTYVEGAGCPGCGPGGIPTARHSGTLPIDQIWSSDQQGIDQIVWHGGHATLNHWVNGPASYPALLALDGYGSFEIFNNYHRMWDDRRGNDLFSNRMIAAWDYLLQHKSTRIWGVAVNDWFSAWTPLGPTSDPANFPDVTPRNRDRGKLQVLLQSHKRLAYRVAFEAGAFFAVVEDNETKSAYPTVFYVRVKTDSIAIATIAGTETIRWIGNGVGVGTGSTLSLSGLPAGLRYVRAEIDDGRGRKVFTQPFTLSPRL